MARAGRIEIEFAANLARLQQDVTRATSILDGFARTAKASIATLGVGLSVAGFASFVKSTADAYDKLGKLGQQTGLTAQQVSKLSYIAKMVDTDVEQLAKGVKILDRNMFQAAQGGGKAYESFRTLGVAVKSAEGVLRGNEEILGDLADRFSKMPDGAMKTALAMQIFGRSGADMIPMLNLGREGLKYFADEAERLKGVLTDEIVQKADAIQMAFKRFDVVREVAGKQLFAGMADDILRIVAAWDLLITKTNTWKTVGAVAGFVLKGIAGAFTALAFAAEYVVQLVLNQIDLFKTGWDRMADVVNNSGIKKAFEEAFGVKLNLPQFNEARVGLDVINARLEAIKSKYREIARAIDLFGQREVKMPPIPKVPTGPEPAVPISDKIMKEWDAAQQKLEKISSSMATDLDRFAPGIDAWEKKIVDVTKAYADMESETEKLRKHFADYPEFVAQINRVAAAIPIVRDEVIKLIRAEQALAEARRQADAAFADAQHRLDVNRWRLTGGEQAQAEIKALEQKRDALKSILASMPADSRRNAFGVAMKDQIDMTERLIEGIRMRNTVETDALSGTLKALTDLETQYKSTGKLMEDYTRGLFMSMEQYFANFCDTGKFEFKDFVRSALINLNTLLFKIAVLEPMAANLRAAISGIGGGRGGGGGLGGFLGGVSGGGFGSDLFSLFGGSSGMFFAKGGVIPFARGGLVTSPTVFPMASGMGLMGEAGPEAVVPLKRTASGDLGIQGGAGGSIININITAADSQSFYDMCRRNPSAITDPIERALQGNQSIRRTIMRTAK